MTNIINIEALLTKNKTDEVIAELDRIKDMIYHIDDQSLEMTKLTSKVWFKLCQIRNDIYSNDSLENIEAKLIELKDCMLSQKCS